MLEEIAQGRQLFGVGQIEEQRAGRRFRVVERVALLGELAGDGGYS